MSKHLTDIELFELANQLIENETQKSLLSKHISECDSCRIQFEQEQELDELLSNKLIVNQTIDVSEKVTQHFSLKEFAKAPDTKWMLYAILILVSILTGMELIDGSILNLGEHINANYIHYMRIIISATTSLLFFDVLVKFVKYRKQVI